MHSLDAFAQEKLSGLEARGLRRRLADTVREDGIWVERNGRRLLSFSCNDYLGLTRHPALEAAAIAKQVASIAAVPVAEIAHAVHGAIGISEEYDLQLYTRRLHEWRLADGSEAYWAAQLGAARLAAANQSSVDFIRAAAGA